MARLARDQDQDEAEKANLERQLAATNRAKPSDEQLARVQSLTRRLEQLDGAELAEIRGKIAAVLPSLLKALTCGPDGKVVATLSTGTQIDLGAVSGHAVKDGFQIGPSALRPGEPIQRLAAGQPDIAAFVPFEHPKGANEARYKAAGKALAAFKASQRKTTARKGGRAL
jgi:hypothetical protein